MCPSWLKFLQFVRFGQGKKLNAFALKTKPGELDFGCLAGDRVEPKEPDGAWNIETRKTTDGDSVELLKQVISVDNMFNACDRVVSKGGAVGIDGIGSRLCGI